MKAYHFTANKLRDGSPIPAIGEWLEHTGPLELCRSGLHASIHPFDALTYAPGNLVHLVELDGEIIRGGDKLVASRRKIIATIDAEQLMREFARKCALDVVHLWDAPEIVVRYLKTGDESIRDAARDAARASARDAARDAAWDAARDAAWASANAAARDAARDSARRKHRARFKRMVTKAFKETK